MSLSDLVVPAGYTERLMCLSRIREGNCLMVRLQFAVVIAAAFLCAAPAAYAHGGRPGHIDEGPGPGTLITVIMVISWIIIALGVVLLVFRLIRTGGRKGEGADKEEKV
jgi:hypothetical protein